MNALFERWYPFGAAAIAAVISLYFCSDVFCAIEKGDLSVTDIYQSVFDISTIFTAFLFTFYTIIVTTESGFIGAVKSTQPYKSTLSYTATALFVGFLLTIFTIPMIVSKLAPATSDTLGQVLVSLWFGLAVYAALGFFRAAHIFWVMTKGQATHGQA